MQLIQIIHFINEIEKYLKLKQGWDTLPPSWSVRSSTRATTFTFLILLRKEASAEGDGIHLFDFDSTDGQSEARIGVPRRVTVARLRLPYSTRSSYNLYSFLSILCAEWKLLLLLHFPFDDKGSLTRPHLYLMEKYIDSCHSIDGQEEVKLYMVVIPVLVKKRPKLWKILSVYTFHELRPPFLTHLPSYPIAPRSRGLIEAVHLTPLI